MTTHETMSSGLRQITEAMDASHEANGGLGWVLDAACGDLDPALLFPTSGGRPPVHVCATCPVLTQCKAHLEALPPSVRMHGMFAGTVGNQRARALRAERAAPVR